MPVTSTSPSKTEAARGILDRYFSSSLALLLPVLVVILALMAAYTFQVKSSWNQRRQIQAQLAELRKELPRAQFVSTKMLELSRDLVVLGVNNPLAGQIVKEFHIRIDPAGGKKKDSSPQ
jgi:hypothetical protein